MSIITTNNIQISSAASLSDRRVVLGDQISSTSLATLDVLRVSLNFAMSQLNAGAKEYSGKIYTLERMIETLKYKCSDICAHKTL